MNRPQDPSSYPLSPSSSGNHHPPADPQLSPGDAQALEAELAARLGLAGGTDGPLSINNTSDTSDSQRRRNAAAILDLLDTWTVEQPPADLTTRTLAAIRTRDNIDRQVQELAGPPIAFRWTELIGVAAILMIAVSLGWPLLSRATEDARRVACQQHLQAAGQGLAQYAADDQGVLPRYAAAVGAPWWRVGQPFDSRGQVQSNSANLYRAVRSGHVQPAALLCPGNPHSVSNLPADAHDFPNPLVAGYSMQNQFTPQPIKLEDVNRTVILADRTPLLIFEHAGKVYFAAERGLAAKSLWHGKGQLGQNALFGDGAVKWISGPELPNGDNIWLPNGVREYRTFTETPTAPTDAALVP